MASKMVMSRRRARARQMKLEGKSYIQIGRELGVSLRCAAYLLAPSESDRKKLVGQTDGRCYECGKKAKRLMAHHDDYNQEPSRMLCQSCHGKLHGRMKLSDKYWELEDYTVREICDDKEKYHQITIEIPNSVFIELDDESDRTGIENNIIILNLIKQHLGFSARKVSLRR